MIPIYITIYPRFAEALGYIYINRLVFNTPPPLIWKNDFYRDNVRVRILCISSPWGFKWENEKFLDKKSTENRKQIY